MWKECREVSIWFISEGNKKKACLIYVGSTTIIFIQFFMSSSFQHIRKNISSTFEDILQYNIFSTPGYFSSYAQIIIFMLFLLSLSFQFVCKNNIISICSYFTILCFLNSRIFSSRTQIIIFTSFLHIIVISTCPQKLFKHLKLFTI